MDFFRGADFGPDDQGYESDDVSEALPPVIGQDERRMQVRAYNYWASLLGKRRFPSPERLITGDLPEFSSHAVLLHFADGIEDPRVLALGASLAAECREDVNISRLSDVPGRSVLSRITDHYLQIIANEAPIGFEAEFVNAQGATILYRGILLPFSTDDAAIDYIYGVINWKELADQRTTDELLLEIGNALNTGPVARRKNSEQDEVQHFATQASPSAWADGPLADEHELELDLSPFLDGDAALPGASPSSAPFNPDVTEPDKLADWLERARACALRAQANDDRTRQSLYAAIGRAWDFALAAQDAPDDYTRLLAEAGLVAQDRAPLIPLVKLVFGIDYDKTRLTEYATVLSHARRLQLGTGELSELLIQTEGGIKALVARERAIKRGEVRDIAPRKAWQATARTLAARPLTELSNDGAEFALVLVRRTPGEAPTLVGELPDNAALLERAARHLFN